MKFGAHSWRALRHRNFRLYFSGQSISLIGTWMTRVATGWLVYRLTGSALLLGTISFAGQIPTFLLAPFAAVWMERWHRRDLLVATQALSLIQSFALGFLTLFHHITMPEVLGLSVMQGMINAFDMPARQTFLIQMVDDRADLSNAIALNSSMVTLARLLGPSIAGLIIAATGEAWCFLIDGISYFAVIASLFAMRVPKSVEKRKVKSTIEELRAGWSYVSAFVPIRTILLLFALVSLMGFPFVVLMPIFAVKILHGGPHALGFLTGAMGAGAVVSALSLVVRKNVRGLLRMIPIASGVFGLGLIGFGVSHIYAVSLITLVIAGFGMMQMMGVCNTIIQTLVEDDKRGRVMAYYTMCFVGMGPFGSLLAGTMAHNLGAPLTVMLNGVLLLFGAAWFWTRMPALRDHIRPIYRELGILPPETAN